MPLLPSGSLVAAVTPFTDDLELDLASFTAHLSWLKAAGSAGVVVAGTTGEGAALTASERRCLLEAAVELASENFAVVGNISAMSTRVACEEIASWHDLPLTAVLSTVPPYVKPSPEGVVAHFAATAAATAHPIIIYNVPHRVGVDIAPETIARLSAIEGVAGVKDASGDPDRTRQHLQVFENSPKRLTLYCGDDKLLPQFYADGGDGSISVLGNLVPRHAVAVSKTGELVREGGELPPLWSAALELCSLGANPEPVKWGVSQLQENFADNFRLPLIGMNAAQIERAQPLLDVLRKAFSESSL